MKNHVRVSSLRFKIHRENPSRHQGFNNVLPLHWERNGFYLGKFGHELWLYVSLRHAILVQRAPSMWIYFLAGAAYGFAAGAQPGPLNAYLLSITLRHGFRRALPATLAPLFSDAIIVSVMLFLLMRMPVGLIRWLHLFGGAFVLYLAWGSYMVLGVFCILWGLGLNPPSPGAWLEAQR